MKSIKCIDSKHCFSFHGLLCRGQSALSGCVNVREPGVAVWWRAEWLGECLEWLCVGGQSGLCGSQSAWSGRVVVRVPGVAVWRVVVRVPGVAVWSLKCLEWLCGGQST